MTTHIKLYGAKADRFEAIKADIGSKQGFEPTNLEVVDTLMAAYLNGRARQRGLPSGR